MGQLPAGYRSTICGVSVMYHSIVERESTNTICQSIDWYYRPIYQPILSTDVSTNISTDTRSYIILWKPSTDVSTDISSDTTYYPLIYRPILNTSTDVSTNVSADTLTDTRAFTDRSSVGWVSANVSTDIIINQCFSQKKFYLRAKVTPEDFF